ncbi:hypothetical protein ACP4OV_029664 [Aristida adscensionis]
MKGTSVSCELVALLFLLAIPLHQARTLGVYEKDHHLSLLLRPEEKEASGEAAVLDHTEHDRSSGGGGGEDDDAATTTSSSSGSPPPRQPEDGALHRPGARTPPSPQPRYPPHPRRQPGAGGSRRPPAPPAPAGCRPPHRCRRWSSSERRRRQPAGRAVLDVLLLAWDRLMSVMSGSRAVEIAKTVHGAVW